MSEFRENAQPGTSAKPAPGGNQNVFALSNWSPTTIFAAGIFTICMVLAIWFGVVQLNRGFDSSNLNNAGRNEMIAAKADHDAILTVGQLCAKALTASSTAIPVDDYLWTMAAASDQPPKPDTPKPAGHIALEAPSYILSAIVMSHHIGWARIALAEQQQWSSIATQIFQWSMVVIGAITTVLISIKTISNERTPDHAAIGIAAIVFSTIGTAIATMNSYYAPRVAYDHDARSLQALQVLHLQLATGILREDHVCDQPIHWPNDWRLKRIKSITEQYTAVMNAAQAPVSTPESDEPTPQKPNEPLKNASPTAIAPATGLSASDTSRR